MRNTTTASAIQHRDRAQHPARDAPARPAAARPRAHGAGARRSAAWRARRRRGRAAEARPCASGRRGIRARPSGPRDPWVAACSPVWWPIVSTGCVIGVDLGGTKLLAGAVDPALNVHHRATRSSRGCSQEAILESIVDGDPRDPRRDRGGVGNRRGGRHRDPLPDRPGARDRGDGRQPAARRPAVSRPHGRAHRPAGVRRQRRQRRDARRVALRRGRRRPRRGAADARHGDRRRARRRRRAAARQPGRGRGARPHGRPGRRPALSGQLPEQRLPGGDVLGDGAWRARRSGSPASARLGARARARGGARDHRRARHRARTRRRRRRHRRAGAGRVAGWVSGSRTS